MSPFFIITTNLTEILAEEIAIRQKADEVKARKEEIETARGITVEDLTKGLLNYKYTGLTFEQCDKGALRYVCLNVLYLCVCEFCLLAVSN